MRMRQVSFILAALAALCSLSARAQDVVRPEAAFPYELAADGDRLEVRFSLLAS